MSAVVKQAKTQIVAAVGPDQVAIGIPDGCTRIFCAASAQLRLDPNRVLLAEDCSSAHQSLCRKYALDQYSTYAPMLCQPASLSPRGTDGRRRVHGTCTVASAKSSRVSVASGRATPWQTLGSRWPLSSRPVPQGRSWGRGPEAQCLSRC